MPSHSDVTIAAVCHEIYFATIKPVSKEGTLSGCGEKGSAANCEGEEIK